MILPLSQLADSVESSIGFTLSEVLNRRLIYTVFQPIYDLQEGDIIGFEALSRGPENSNLHLPDQLFNAVAETDEHETLERLCREQALETFSKLKLPGKLFLNVSASLLNSVHHPHGVTVSLMNEHGVDQSRVVIELSEKHPYDHCSLNHGSVEHYRDMGFSIAIDDLGVGYSGLRLWSEVQPEYVKIDRHFITQIEKNPVKREFVRSIVAIAQSLHCQVIAEGIETVAELDLLLELGVTRGQGYLLGRPVTRPEPVKNKLLLSRARRQAQYRSQDGSEAVLTLCQVVPTIEMGHTLGNVGELFRKHPELMSVPVTQNGEPQGVIRRHDLLELFSTQYGRALYEGKSLNKLLKTDVLVVDSLVSLADVSKQLTQTNDSLLTHDILIVQDGSLLGVASLRDLLKRITELKVRNATYSHPLTGLPGSVPINREVDRRLSNAMDFRLAYIDLNHFKGFNEAYGYAKGDLVIQRLGALLKQHLTSVDNTVGHIGGDDFVVIMGCDDWQLRLERILDAFEDQISDLYDPQDLTRGVIHIENHDQNPQIYPLLSIVIGVVHPDPYSCQSHLQVAELTADAKQQARQQEGHSLFVSRRRKPR
jgi:diguanylate cyclase (GGDEF)-like protein